MRKIMFLLGDVFSCAASPRWSSRYSGNSIRVANDIPRVFVARARGKPTDDTKGEARKKCKIKVR